jgi:hypothetical protein
MDNKIQILEPVDFYGQKLLIVSKADEPYVVMKPVVEGMGLNWAAQHRRLTDDGKRFCIAVMAIQVPGDTQLRETITIPLRKLPGWLMTLQPSRMAPEVGKKVEVYQNECDDMLWDSWNRMRFRITSTNSEKTKAQLLLESVQLLVEQEHKFSQLTSRVEAIEQRVETREQLSEEAIQELKGLPEPEKPAKPLTVRAKISRVVRDYTKMFGLEYAHVWITLYTEFRDRYGIDLRILAKNRGIAPMDMAERLRDEGDPDIMDNLYAVAYEIFVTRPQEMNAIF